MSAETELNVKEVELISASLDEDLSEFERRRLNTNVLAKPKGERTWNRYNLISAVMKNQFPAQIDKDFASQVMQKIREQGYEQEEESATQVKIKRVGSHLKQVAGLAVAASVAVFSMVTYQYFHQPASTDATEVVLSQSQPSADNMKSVDMNSVQDSQRVELSLATAQQQSSQQITKRQHVYPQPVQVPIRKDISSQELAPYIQHHVGFGSQREISPYIEIIELKDIKE